MTRLDASDHPHPAAVPAAGEPVARYVLRSEHHVRALVRTSAASTRRVQVRYGVYAAVMLATWAAGHVLTGGAPNPLLLYGSLVFAAFSVVRPLVVRRQAERLVADRPDVGRPVEVRVAAGEFDVRVEGVARSAQRLDTLHAVHVAPEGVFVEPFRNEALFVPAEAFASPADRAAFERALLAGARIPGPTL
ncbi:MAG TPA: hypothetical protein VGB53_11890 [Rubricoccaceae bacterium]